MPRSRKTIEEGISRINGRGLSAKVQVGSGPDALQEEKAFDAGSSLKEIRRWREETRVKLRKEVPIISKGSIAAEVKSYLERAKKRPASLGSKRSEMKAWVAEIGHLRRHQVKPEHIDRAIAAWLADDVAKKTALNRCRTLHHFYVTMADDKKVHTPLDNVDVPRPPKTKPVFVSAAVIKRVEKKLRKYPLEHAYYLTMTSTGLRPAQIDRLRQTLTAAAVRAGVVMVEGGKGGEPIPMVLNADQRAAFSVLLKVTGTRDASRYARVVRAAGWPSGVRPYNARHAVGIELAERGVDDSDIQKQLGHSSIQMVRQFYTGVRLTTMKRLSKTLAERNLGWQKVSPADVPRKNGRTRQNVAETGAKARDRKTA